MSRMFLFVLIGAQVAAIVVTVLMAKSIVVIFEYLQPFGGFNFVVADKLAMVERYHGQNLVHFLFAIVGVHVFCWDFELL